MLTGRGQGCCSISYDTQHSLPPRRVFWLKGHSAEVEEPWSGAKWTRSHDMGVGPELLLSGLSTPPAALLRPPPWLSLAQQISLNFNFNLSGGVASPLTSSACWQAWEVQGH